ncbi:hypothetical protein PBN151_2828 [Paenibacillus sp. NAIST15-1]|nr:hypothetical protein PBN151_2828 [Paenibacillus sp. NAIST15-1]
MASPLYLNNGHVNVIKFIKYTVLNYKRKPSAVYEKEVPSE